MTRTREIMLARGTRLRNKSINIMQFLKLAISLYQK